LSTEIDEEMVENRSGIPGIYPETSLGADSYTGRENMKAFYQRGRYVGANEGYGASISDTDRLFYSTREPVGVWWVKRVAYDIWDNWFRVVDPEDKDDKTLDADVQRVLRDLDAHRKLPQLTMFERRYGTSVLLLSYTGFGSEASWETPLFALEKDGKPPKRLPTGKRLLQITPYPWTMVNVDTLDDNTGSTRFGHPEYYTIDSGSGAGDSTNPQGTQANRNIKVHWTRVIHDAPRLDQHPYLGVAAIDEIFDDLVGGRNARWGAYESYYRHGTGFPVIKTKATTEQNKAWIAAGGLDDYLHVRGYFMCHVDEDFKFVGAEGATLNPNTYFDMYFTFIAAGTGVAKDTIQGVSAGRVTGSEVNERQYYKSISLHQNQEEPMLRELLDRLIQTGQVEHEGDYEVEWVDPFEVNPQDKAAIEFMDARTMALKSWMTVNEIRAKFGLPPRDDGDVLMLQPGQLIMQGSNPAPNQKAPERGETEPEESEKNESTLLDRVIDAALRE